MSAISFYKGAVTHRRYNPVTHKLRYRIAYVLLDLDELDAAAKVSHLFGIERAAAMSFRARDHGSGTDQDLAGWVRTYLEGQGVEEDAARIVLLTLPRMFGYVFNPISVYFIYDEAGEVHHILYEVNNTFSERHFYLCRASTSGGVIEQSEDKQFYVSPFFDVDGAYHFRVMPPEEKVSLAIRYEDSAGQLALTATLAGTRSPFTTGQCARILLQFPFMTLGVVLGIHWHALKLWLKGLKYRSRKGLAAKRQLTQVK